MSDQAVRVVVVIVVVAAAVGVAFVARRLQRPMHPQVLVGDVGDRPGVVLFTSTDCGNCKKAIAVLKDESIPFREVTHDLESQRFESWSVHAVPLTVVIDVDGVVVDMVSGVPSHRFLAKALRSAGIERK